MPQIEQFNRKAKRAIIRFLDTYLPGGIVGTCIAVVLAICFFFGNGILSTAILVGGLTALSFIIVLYTMPVKYRNYIMKSIAWLSSWIDICMTVLLIIAGIHVGVLMAISLVALSMCMTLCFAIVRWIYFLTNPEEKLRFQARTTYE